MLRLRRARLNEPPSQPSASAFVRQKQAHGPSPTINTSVSTSALRISSSAPDGINDMFPHLRNLGGEIARAPTPSCHLPPFFNVDPNASSSSFPASNTALPPAEGKTAQSGLRG